ncbi:MAG TPA: NUDIX domain-containing protein [Tepidiformaceae bacterium]|nr:NUDIX domain-containing protein [Tepidiformaceae bacterium]
MVDFSQLGALAERVNRSYAPVELNIGDEWRAMWEDVEPMPLDVPVGYVYGVLVMDDKGFVIREKGSEKWGTLEGAPAKGEKPDAALKRFAKEYANATAARVELIGYLDCKATSHNPDHPAGTRSVRPMYLFSAKQVKDLGRAAGYERRRLPMNEYMMALRQRYPEIDEYMGRAVERYLVLRARGEL